MFPDQLTPTWTSESPSPDDDFSLCHFNVSVIFLFPTVGTGDFSNHNHHPAACHESPDKSPPLFLGISSRLLAATDCSCIQNHVKSPSSVGWVEREETNCCSAAKFKVASSIRPTKKHVAETDNVTSILLLSPTNQVLLLHRVKTSSSFASAHVFPGGNLDAFHDGDIPAEDAQDRHTDGPAYRIGAIRECFEETGILLARRKGAKDDAALVSLPTGERDAARKQIHGNHLRFSDWAEKVGGVPDVEGLIPFTRWVTPTNVPKRFTTQMYLYLLPDTAAFDRVEAAQQQEIIVPTPDGGVEHTAARFDDAAAWLAKADAGEIILFPPQYYLLHHVARFCSRQGAGTSFSVFESQREKLLEFLRKTPTASSDKGTAHPTSSIPWSEKVMSPQNLLIRSSDNRVVLGLDKPGPELKDSGRGGDWERVVLVKFSKEGPRKVEVRDREQVLAEEREEKAGEGSGTRHKL